MSRQVQTLNREYDNARERDRAIANAAKEGWRVAQVTAMPGHYRAGRGCCLFALFPPLAFLAGRTEDRWLVVYERP